MGKEVEILLNVNIMEKTFDAFISTNYNMNIHEKVFAF